MRYHDGFFGEGLIAGAMVLVSAVALAQHSDSNPIDCTSWTTGTLGQTDMNICAARAADQKQQQLQALLQDLRRKISSDQPGQWSVLEANQRVWKAFIDRHCRWESAFAKGGSLQPMIQAMCVADATARRIDRLSGFLCEGEGTTGPCPESKRYTAAVREAAPNAAGRLR